MRVILVGETNLGSRTPQRLRALEALGHDVNMVSTTPVGWTYETQPTLWDRICYRLRLPRDKSNVNAALKLAAYRGCDAILLDNARTVHASTLKWIKRNYPRIRLIWYCEDDMMNSRHRTRWLEGALSLFDLWATTKSFNARPEEMPSLGVRKIMFVNNAFDTEEHRPLELTSAEKNDFGADVAFVGTFEKARAMSLLALAEAGISVRVWGNGWGAWKTRHSHLRIEDRPVYGADYVKVTCASKINLGFLRKFNRDLQTCRSMEIPAMGGFMMHEYNDEIASLFIPDQEAAFFGNDQELIQKSRRWLLEDVARETVAKAGRTRVLADNRSHQGQLSQILSAALETL